MMRLHNTASGSLETFMPQQDDDVTLYTCGPTVYSEPLIGNWVAYIRWDLLVRTLMLNGYEVTRVMNITDVGHLVSDADEGEDKMEKGARQEGLSAWEVADRYTELFLRGMNELNLIPPTVMPRATDHIAEQIEFIQRLESKGHTYRIDDGIYFDTATFPAYGDFAHLDLAGMQTAERMQANINKRNPSDFALWKFSPTTHKRDMQWDSPWGIGFPGWHIECSAMALKYLGETLDIHTGGIDHIPVHHTNEIAQTESLTKKPLARYWLHANFLLAEGKKISKSLNNGYSLTDLQEKGYSAMDFKMFVLQSQYRTESNFTWENLAAAHARLKHWHEVAVLRHQSDDQTETHGTDKPIDTAALISAITDALSTDLNSPQALTLIEKGFAQFEHGAVGHSAATSLETFLQFIDNALGLGIIAATSDINPAQKEMLRTREKARADKDWGRSDELRDALASEGIGVSDNPAGTRWYYL